MSGQSCELNFPERRKRIHSQSRCRFLSICLDKATYKRTQRCWPTTPKIALLDVHDAASVWAPRCMLLRIVGSCYAKFETGQIFQATTPNISYVSFSPKRSATMLDSFAQLFPTLLGPGRRIIHALVFKVLWVVSFPPCTAGPNIVAQQCWEFSHAFANHCKHGRINSQHCWPNNVESLYVALRDYEQLHMCS